MKGEVKKSYILITSAIYWVHLAIPANRKKIAFADLVFGNHILDHRTKNLKMFLFVVYYLFCFWYLNSDG